MVINTWGGPFTAATDAAFLALTPATGPYSSSSSSLSSSSSSVSALDAVQIGCSTCERNRCDGSVGYGGSPDENCETTLDAMIMDGTTMEVGAVAGLRRVRDAIAAARLVLEYTEHTMLAGDLATRFAVDFGGLAEEDLGTGASAAACLAWRTAACQPNYRKGGGGDKSNVIPDPRSHCGPYVHTTTTMVGDGTGDYLDRQRVMVVKDHADDAKPEEMELLINKKKKRADGHDDDDDNNNNNNNKPLPARSHDTISMVALHADGSMAAGTSTNGATHKIPGRVGDGPITGSGSYVDGDVGGCGATGDGDIMMRFLPCYQAVESMRRGLTPQAAADDAVRRMVNKFPRVSTGIVVVNNKGEHGGAGSGWTFTYSFRGGTMNETKVVTVPPLSL